VAGAWQVIPCPLWQTVNYGWQIHPNTGKVFFNSGLIYYSTWNVGAGSRCGTVAFAGSQGSYGNLVVVNHQREDRAATPTCRVLRCTGQTVNQGNLLGTVQQGT